MLRSTKVMDCPQPTPSCGQLTDVTLSGNINGEWENCGGAVTSLFGGRAIIRQNMCMSIGRASCW